MSECCKAGFAWQGKPSGEETTLGKNKAYVTGTNKDAAILMIHDVFGWALPNARLLADHYAKEAHATVYLPDYFDGQAPAPETMDDPEKRKNFDLMGFMGKHNKDIRGPEMVEHATTLKSQYKKVGAIGFCYGGWAVFRLGAKGAGLVDAISTAHPSALTKEEIDNVGVPVQILAPETDPLFTPELKEYANKVIPTLGVEYDYQYFPEVVHGFAVRGDPNDPKSKKALERAKNAAVSWFIQQLH